jgi:stage V sporulation protein G
MEVTDVRIRKLNVQDASEGGGKMRAIVSVTFDNEFVVHDIKEDGTYKDIAHPIKVNMRNKIQDAVLARYTSALSEAAAAITEVETFV